MNKMLCRPLRQRILIARPNSRANDNSTTTAVVDCDDDGSLPAITTDVDLSDHPLGAVVIIH